MRSTGVVCERREVTRLQVKFVCIVTNVMPKRFLKSNLTLEAHLCRPSSSTYVFRGWSMSCPTGHIARGGLVLQGSSRFVRLLRTCGISQGLKARKALPFSTQHCASRGYADPVLNHTSASSRHRPSNWGCRLTTSCQVAASSPHAATVQAAEKKQSRKSGGVVTLPTTDESAELDRIRHSVSMITELHRLGAMS